MSRHSSKVYSTGGRIERSIVKHLHKLRDGLLPGEAGVKAYALLNPFKLKFHCPICDYRGPFFDSYRRSAGQRPHARCPRCDSMERHRLQFLVVQRLAQRYDFASMSMLHMAPEKFFMELFRRQFGAYVGANLQRNRGVDLQANLCALPFCDGQFDAIYASHILEHIKNDLQAILEVKRVLREGAWRYCRYPWLLAKRLNIRNRTPTKTSMYALPVRTIMTAIATTSPLSRSFIRRFST